MSDEELFRRARRVIPGGVHSPVRAFRSVGGTPVFMRSGHGAHIESETGRRYIDFQMAFGPLILGHAPESVAAAVRGALDQGWSFGTAEARSLELAELIRDRLPWAERIRFMNSGTEAVMTALRLARAATGRTKILKFDGCYHGHADAVLIRAGSGLAGTGEASSSGIPAGVSADTLVAELDHESGLQEIFSAHGDGIAAAIIEPLPANYGLLPQRRAFLQMLADLCARHGSLLIFDEVITGFRLGFGGCTEAWSLQPDLVTWGKIIGGGFPVGAVAGAAELLEQLAPTGEVYQAGTLSANPVAMAAGLATLGALRDGEIYSRLEALGQQLEAAITAVPGIRLQRAGSLFWLVPGEGECLRRPQALPAGMEAWHRKLFHAALEAGIYLPPSHAEVCFLSAAHGVQDIELLTQFVAAQGHD